VRAARQATFPCRPANTANATPSSMTDTAALGTIGDDHELRPPVDLPTPAQPRNSSRATQDAKIPAPNAARSNPFRTASAGPTADSVESDRSSPGFPAFTRASQCLLRRRAPPNEDAATNTQSSGIRRDSPIYATGTWIAQAHAPTPVRKSCADPPQPPLASRPSDDDDIHAGLWGLRAPGNHGASARHSRNGVPSMRYGLTNAGGVAETHEVSPSP
jgi:hypothetical protein